MGVLSALPIVAVGNFCCCLWVVCGGAVAAYVLQQNQQMPVTPGDAALAGLLSSRKRSVSYAPKTAANVVKSLTMRSGGWGASHAGRWRRLIQAVRIPAAFAPIQSKAWLAICMIRPRSSPMISAAF